MQQIPGGWADLSAAEAVRHPSPQPAIPADAADLEIRMSPLHLLRVYLATTAAAALSGAGLLFRLQVAEHPDRAGTTLLAFLWVAVPAVFLLTIYSFRIRVRVTGDEVIHYGWASRLRFPVHTADHAFKYGFTQLRGGQFRLFVVRDTSGRCALSLFGMAWRDSDLDRLTSRLGLQQAGWYESVYSEARRDCPAGGLPIFAQHPVIWTIICIPIALALVIVPLALVLH